MSEMNWAANQAVNETVWWAVYWAVDDDVCWAVGVVGDVSRAVIDAVDGIVYEATQDDPDHPGLEDFLRSVEFGGT